MKYTFLIPVENLYTGEKAFVKVPADKASTAGKKLNTHFAKQGGEFKIDDSLKWKVY